MNHNLPVTVPSLKYPSMIAFRKKDHVNKFSSFLEKNYKEYDLDLFVEYNRQNCDGTPSLLRCARNRFKSTVSNTFAFKEIQRNTLQGIIDTNDKHVYAFICDLGILGCDIMEIREIMKAKQIR
jgi:hypothetical protein